MLNLSKNILYKQHMYKDKKLYEDIIKSVAYYELQTVCMELKYQGVLERFNLDLPEFMKDYYTNNIKLNIVEALVDNDLYSKQEDFEINMYVFRDIMSASNRYSIYYKVKVTIEISFKPKYDFLKFRHLTSYEFPYIT